jgi:hypothetical protein
LIRSFAYWRLFGLLFLLLSSGSVLAQEAGSLSQQINASQTPDQLYQLGLRALSDNQPELARQALERVVGLQPNFAGAWLDLALATYRSGDSAAAVEHLEYLRSQFPLSPALVAQVDYWLNLWQSAPQPIAPPGWQGEIQFGGGYDGNANTGLTRQQIPLSLPGGDTLFDVDKAYLPRTDRFALFAMTLAGPAWTLGPGRINPVLLLRSKQLAQERDFSTFDLQPGLVYQQPAGQGDGPSGQAGNWQANLLAQHYRLGGQVLFNGLRLALQRNQLWQTCLSTAGSEMDARRHLRIPNLGGTLYSFSAGLACPLPSRGDNSFKATLGATLKLGFEQARANRAGGNNRSAELIVRYEQPLSATQSLQATWQIARTADQEGYSPLLEDNAPRHLQRQTLSLGLRQTLTPTWEARVNFEYFQQRANLPLFEQQGSLLMLSLGWRFE